eukprot:Clim_evm38s214 gene=Clim_evmTU38s214
MPPQGSVALSGTVEGAHSEVALKYWKEKLADVAYLQLPSDYPRPTQDQIVEASESHAPSDDVCKKLLKYALMRDLKPFTVCMSAFLVLLHKYTREEDIVVGSSASNFNPLLIRMAVKDASPLSEILASVAQIEQEAYDNDVPFDILVKELTVGDGSQNLSGLFQARFFNVTDVSQETLDIANASWTIYVEQMSDSKRLLPLNFKVIYNSLLFARERMTEVLKQLEMVIDAIVSDNEGKVLVQDVCIRTDESRAYLPDPSGNLSDFFQGSISEIMHRNAELYPDRACVVENDKSWDYAHMDAESNRLANYLLSKGVQKEDVVALYAHRSAAIVIGIMGILKAGCTFTVIDPQYPTERQTIYLSVAKPRVIIEISRAGRISQEVKDYIVKELNVVAHLESLHPDQIIDEELKACPTTYPNVVVGPNNIGTLSFTSGSTGIPKGVRGRHISLTHFYPWMSEEFGIGKNDRFTMLSGIAHDPIQRDVFTPLFFGASIHIPEFEDIMTPGRLAKWMQESGSTVTHLTPAMGQLLTANATEQMPALKNAFFVGDVLTKRDTQKLQSLAPNVTVINMYGTTETQRAVSYYKVTPDAPIDFYKDIIPAGRGMKDVQILVLSDNKMLTGVGELGELYTRSPHLSAGYLRLPDATAEKFLPNPFKSLPEGGDQMMDRLYRTGDLGRYMADGSVECIGRADFQVKIRGFRIELGEIDTYLTQHPDVSENVTLVRRDANEEKMIVSYIVPAREDWDEVSVRDWLKSKLPAYAVPTIIAPLSRMPLTPNGKIDRAKLPFPEAAMAALASQSQAGPSEDMTPMQRKIHEVWVNVLKRPVRLTDNFFDIGGHSILATQLTFQLRTILRSEMPLNLLYSFPTIEGLAAEIEKSSNDPEALVFKSSRDNTESVSMADEVKELVDDEIKGNPEGAFKAEPNGIFLTGATGFLGAFMLNMLLKAHPNTTVFCLVRAKNKQAGFDRLSKNLKAHLQWEDSFSDRLSAVIGNLTSPLLGLEESEFNALAEKCDVVIHNGAMVHWVYPYSKLKPMNVVGTREALRLAARHHTKPFHFISSTSVLDAPKYMQMTEGVLESTNLVPSEDLTVGYGQSKWIAEAITLEANRRGIPSTIFRPGYIVGHSKTGVMNLDDFLVRLLKGCLQLGKAPIMENTVNMCPVDYISAAIVEATKHADALGKAYHMANPNAFRFNDYFQCLNKYGYDVKHVEYREWRDELFKVTTSADDHVLYPLLHFVLDDLPNKSKSPKLDTTNMDALVRKGNIECPAMENMLGIYLAYFVAIGYMPQPTNADAKSLPELDIPADVVAVQRSDRKL